MEKQEILREITRLLMEAGKCQDWAIALEKRAEAVRLIKQNLDLIKFVNISELGQKLRAAGCSAAEVQKIIRGVSIAQKAVAAGSATAASAEVGSFITIAGVSLTTIEGAVVVGVVLAVLVGCVLLGWALAQIFFGENRRTAQITVNEYANPFKGRKNVYGKCSLIQKSVSIRFDLPEKFRQNQQTNRHLQFFL